MEVTNNFEDGSTQGWGIGNSAGHPNPPTNVATGGPDGADDNFLQTQANGGAGAGSRLAFFNESADWTGDYAGDGVTGITATANNQGSSNIVLRVALDGAGGRFVTTEGITLSPGSGWEDVAFSIEAADLTAVGGTDVDATLGNVSQIRFINSPTPSYQGAAVPAQLGIDNIATVVAEPPVDPVDPPVDPPTVTPTVSLFVEPAVVSEDGDDSSFTITFQVDGFAEGEFPEEGVEAIIGGGFTEIFAAPQLFDNNVPVPIVPEGGQEFVEILDNGAAFLIRLNAPTVTVTPTIFDDLIEEEPVTFDLEILPGEGYEVGTGIASLTIIDGDSVIPGGGPTVGLSVSDTDLEEGDELIVNFDVDGEIPEDGLELFIAGGPTDLGEFNIFNEDGSPAVELEGIDEFPLQGGDEGGFFVTLNDNQASLTLSVFDDGPGEGEEVLNFELIDGEEYEVNPDASSVDLTINDTPPGTPIVTVTLPDVVSEEDENPILTAVFTVTNGEVPAEGLTVALGGDTSLLFSPDIADNNRPLEFNPPGSVGFVASATPEGEFLLLTTLFASEASVGLPIFNDIIEEPDTDFTFTLEALGDFVIAPGSEESTVTLTDGVPGGVGPTVSLSVSDTDLEEGDDLTVNFDVDGDIPDDGLQLFITSGPTDLGEFNIFNEDGTPAIALDGIDGFPLQGGDEGGFFVTLTDNQASIDLSVFKDGPNEGLEELSFTLANGEGYEVDPAAQNVTLSINDGGEDAEYVLESGVTSVYLDFALLEAAAGITLISADSDAAPAERTFQIPPLPAFQVGFEITEETDFSFAPVGFVPVGGSIEHDGTITLGVGGAEVTVGEFSIGFDPARASDVASGFFVADTLDDALGLEVLFDLDIPATAAVSGIDGDDLNLGDANLLLAPEVATALGNADLAGADVGDARIDALVEVVDDSDLPVVSLFIEPSVVAEDSDNPSFVGTFTVDGEIPEAGLPIIIGGSFLTQPVGLFNDNIPAPWLPEGSFQPTGPVFDDDGNLTGFTVTLFEPSTSSNPFIFDDIIEEEPIELLYSILPGDGYVIGQGDAPLTVIDGPSVLPGSGPTVSLSVSDTDLMEGEEFTVNFEVDGDIPEGGLAVYVDGPAAALSEFNIFGDEGIDPATDIVGLTGLPEPDNDAGGFFATITENQASLTLSVFEDGSGEGEEVLTFDLINGEQYELSDTSSSVDLTINDTPEGTPIVSVALEPSQVSEEDDSPAITATFTVETTTGEEFAIPEAVFDTEGNLVSGGLPILVDGADILTLFDEISGDPVLDGLTIGSFFDPNQPTLVELVLLQSTSTGTLNILNDVIEEADQDYTVTLLDGTPIGSTYAINPEATSGTTTLIDANGGPSVGPTVGITITDADLTEGEEFTLNFAVEGDDLPSADNPLTVLVDSTTFAALGEFALFDENGTPLFSTTGIDGVPTVGDTGASSFLVNLIDSNASITLSVFDDGPDEGLETLTFEIANGELYEVDAAASSVTVSIDDGGIPSVVNEGTDGADRLFGEGGDDTLSGGSEDDTIFGRAGNDAIDGGSEDDRLFGGDGNDTINGGSENDRIAGNAGDDILTGGSGDDRIFASSGTDILDGGSGDDRLFGGDDRDILIGNMGDDFLNGGDGDDVLMGVTGRDVLVGGDGADLFVYGVGDGKDLIRDFEVGIDKIGLVESEFTFDDLTITQSGSRTVLGVASSGETLAVLKGVDASSIGESSFEIVPNVATVEEAMAIL